MAALFNEGVSNPYESWTDDPKDDTPKQECASMSKDPDDQRMDRNCKREKVSVCEYPVDATTRYSAFRPVLMVALRGRCMVGYVMQDPFRNRRCHMAIMFCPFHFTINMDNKTFMRTDLFQTFTKVSTFGGSHLASFGLHQLCLEHMCSTAVGLEPLIHPSHKPVRDKPCIGFKVYWDTSHKQSNVWY